MTTLTTRQGDALYFIGSHLQRHGYAPSMRELARCIEVKSLASVTKLLEQLERKEMIFREPGQHRALRLTKKGGWHFSQGRAA